MSDYREAGEEETGDVSRRPMGGFLSSIVRSKKLRSHMPGWVKRLGNRILPAEAVDYEVRDAEDPYADQPESDYPGAVDVTIGILKGFGGGHADYVAACRELRVPYKVLDITGSDWIGVVRDSGCDAFVIWPFRNTSVRQRFYDDWLRILAEDLGKIVYPEYKALWLYESKRRMAYWLQANDIPHPRTWIFYRPWEALGFARTADLPIVAKTDIGAGARGVEVFRNRSRLRRYIKRAFGRGIRIPRVDPRDRLWGSVLLQEYLPKANEWRMIRINRTFFGHQKGKIGDFHSGTNIVVFVEPPRELLQRVREVTDLGGFSSMCLDIFETQDGRFLVNELQTVFGSDPIQMKINGKPGRYLYDEEADDWTFEEGVFNRNDCCNLRVEHLLDKLGKPIRAWLPGSIS